MITLTVDKLIYIQQKNYNTGRMGDYVDFTMYDKQVFNLSDLMYEVRDSVLPRIGVLETDKANKVRTPANDYYDGMIADRPDGFNQIKIKWSDFITNSSAGYAQWSIGYNLHSDFRNVVSGWNSPCCINLEMWPADLPDLNWDLTFTIPQLNNPPDFHYVHQWSGDQYDLSDYTDLWGVIWHFDKDTEPGTLIITFDLPVGNEGALWIQEKYQNSGEAGKAVELMMDSEQTFDLSDIIYEVRNSVIPRIGRLETLTTEGDIEDTMEFPPRGTLQPQYQFQVGSAGSIPITINYGTGTTVEWSTDQPGELLLTNTTGNPVDYSVIGQIGDTGMIVCIIRNDEGQITTVSAPFEIIA
jgi:hypothetical protein